ncbi:hypothetical protein NDU88_006651 [Pleurodeles waltl]|uniref:Uncharacterized protein n=1 Tax=Pleurodeles waltl TaxID=8319 RepID=A0AAV7WYU8_PLEWA|nr:hypothetical protein NDU88_006651 [Pleurodeles waltl]
MPGRAESGDLVPREEWDDCCGWGGTAEVRTCPLERAPEWLGLPGTEERGRGPGDGRGRDALGLEAPRVGALKVSGWCARGCLGGPRQTRAPRRGPGPAGSPPDCGRDPGLGGVLRPASDSDAGPP